MRRGVARVGDCADCSRNLASMVQQHAANPGEGSNGSVARQVEVERKYAVPEGVSMPDLGELGSISPERLDILVAEYYDTPDLALLNAHITLRRRTGGEDAGWHLKTPGSGDQRHEMHIPLTRGRRIPVPLRHEVAEIVGERPLLPVVRIRTERTTSDLYRDDGSARAEIVFDVVDARVVRDDVSVHEQWLEIEVELAANESEATFDEIEKVLADAGIRRSKSSSKLGHILRDVPPQERPNETDRAVEVAIAAVAEHFGRFQQLEGAVAVDDPDAVHQARVSLRRMRSILQVYKKVFDRGDAKRLRDELRWAGEKLGGPRDAEVIQEELLALLDALAPEELVGPVRVRIEEALSQRHEREFSKLLIAMTSPRWDSVFAQCTEFIGEVPSSNRGRRPARATLERLAADMEHRVAKRQSAAVKHPDDLERWHEVRKGAKGARYAHEVLAALELPRADEKRELWKEVTSALGSVQDSVILEEQLAAFEVAAGTAGEPVETYQLLRARLVEQRDASLVKARTRLSEVLGR